MASLKNDMNLREKTIYMKILIFIGCNSIPTIYSIPEKWKFLVKKSHENAANLITYSHHLIKDSRVKTLDKLRSTEIYFILILKIENKPSCNINFKNVFFNDSDTDWAAIHILPRLVTYNTQCISSNKRPQHLLNFETVRCGLVEGGAN